MVTRPSLQVKWRVPSSNVRPATMGMSVVNRPVNPNPSLRVNVSETVPSSRASNTSATPDMGISLDFTPLRRPWQSPRTTSSLYVKVRYPQTSPPIKNADLAHLKDAAGVFEVAHHIVALDSADRQACN